MSKSYSLAHIIIAGTIGNVTEWYNFLLYGYLASVISTLFFPSHNELLSLTLTFTVFALSFFARPFGGILFGWIGDRYGRQRALLISLILMAIPTFLIAFLPTYQQIGLLSPLLLCVFRLLQGLSAGGEHTGSAVYLAEYAPPHHRTLWVSTVPTSAALGILLSSMSALFLINYFTEAELLAGAWRIGYLVGALLCLGSILLRITMPETPYFKKIAKEKLPQRYDVAALIKDAQAFKNLSIVISLASSWGIFYQLLFVWMPTYLTQIHHLSTKITLEINSIFIFCFAFLIMLAGYCADYFPRKRLLQGACLAMLLSAFPLFQWLAAGSLLQIYSAIAIFTLIFSIYLPIAFISMIELFRTEIRYTGLSFGFNIGLALFGGTCPLIVTWLIEISSNPIAPAFYMTLAALTALCTTYYLPKTSALLN